MDDGTITTNVIKATYLSSIEGVNWTLPTTDGSAGTVLSIDSSKNLTFESVGGGTSTIQDIEISSFIHTGLISGGTLTVSGGGTTFDIAAGKGVIVTYTNRNSITATTVTWSAKLAQSSDVLGTSFGTWIGINISGTVLTSATPFDAHDTIILGRLRHWDKATITSASEFPLYFNDDMEFARMTMAHGTTNISGNVFSVSGHNLKLDKSAGICYRIGANANTSTLNPNITTLAADTETPFYRAHVDTSDASDVVVIEGGSTVTDINPTKWDDGSGTLADVTSTYYTIQTIIMYPFNTSWRTIILYGQAEYADRDAALAALTSYQPIIPDDIFGGNIRGFLVVREDVTFIDSYLSSSFSYIIFINGYEHGTIS